MSFIAKPKAEKQANRARGVPGERGADHQGHCQLVLILDQSRLVQKLK